MVMWGLLLRDGRLLDVGPSRPATIYEEEGVQQIGTVVPVERVDLTREQAEAGVPMGYDAARRAAIVHPVLGPARQAAEAEGQQAASDLASERPQLRALLAQALAALAADEAQRAVDVAAIAAVSTLAQAKPVLVRMLQREQLRIRLDVRILRLLAASHGIPLGS